MEAAERGPAQAEVWSAADGCLWTECQQQSDNKTSLQAEVRTGFMVRIKHSHPARERTKLLSALAQDKEASTLHDPLVTGGEGVVPSCPGHYAEAWTAGRLPQRADLLEAESAGHIQQCACMA